MAKQGNTTIRHQSWPLHRTNNNHQTQTLNTTSNSGTRQNTNTAATDTLSARRNNEHSASFSSFSGPQDMPLVPSRGDRRNKTQLWLIKYESTARSQLGTWLAGWLVGGWPRVLSPQDHLAPRRGFTSSPQDTGST